MLNSLQNWPGSAAGHGEVCQRESGRLLIELTKPAEDLRELIVSDAPAWRTWLDTHHADSGGVWLVLTKKGAVTPTRLTYDQAVEEALAHGWIDGQGQRRDDASYRVRFTPRRRRSPWSKRNTVIAERLMDEGRMHAAGITEIERAKSDGRWHAAYHGPTSIEVPDDLSAALNAEPAAKSMFAILSAANRYAVLYRIQEAKRPETRARRIERFVAMLARGETVYAQRKTLSDQSPDIAG
jgi:uncharacterized protein YdeI (YjbR/CyaY-like superfamily)